MKCPFCSSENTRVIDSRPADDNNSIRRRRLCDDCGKRFTTYEKVETIPLIVIKKDNIREQYDRSKIEGGVLRACHKRPISADQISKLVDDVEVEIFNREEKEIPSTVIGEILMDKLKDLDSVAYVRFASVYREFKDVNTFMNELKKMLSQFVAMFYLGRVYCLDSSLFSANKQRRIKQINVTACRQHLCCEDSASNANEEIVDFRVSAYEHK